MRPNLVTRGEEHDINIWGVGRAWRRMRTIFGELEIRKMKGML